MTDQLNREDDGTSAQAGPIAVEDVPRESLLAQPPGYWTSEAGKVIVAAIRASLADDGLTQPHWWTLNFTAGQPGGWTRPALAARLGEFAEHGTDLEAVFDDLLARGLLDLRDGTLHPTPEGEEVRARARDRNRAVHRRLRAGIDDDEWLAALDVLRRMIANLGGRRDLP